MMSPYLNRMSSFGMHFVLKRRWFETTDTRQHTGTVKKLLLWVQGIRDVLWRQYTARKSAIIWQLLDQHDSSSKAGTSLSSPVKDLRSRIKDYLGPWWCTLYSIRYLRCSTRIAYVGQCLEEDTPQKTGQSPVGGSKAHRLPDSIHFHGIRLGHRNLPTNEPSEEFPDAQSRFRPLLDLPTLGDVSERIL